MRERERGGEEKEGGTVESGGGDGREWIGVAEGGRRGGERWEERGTQERGVAVCVCPLWSRVRPNVWERVTALHLSQRRHRTEGNIMTGAERRGSSRYEGDGVKNRNGEGEIIPTF